MFRRLVPILSVFMIICAPSTLPAQENQEIQEISAPTDQGRWISSVDYLSWSVRTPDLQYGITDIGGVQDRGPVGTVLAIGGDYDTGYRFSVGRHMAQGPDLIFRYTDFDNSLFESYTGPVRAVFVSSDNGENNDSDGSSNDITPEDRATFASGQLDFELDQYEMELARTLGLTDSLALRLSGGGRAAAINQSFSTIYTGGDFQTPFNAFRNSEYRGGGIMAGADLQWYLLPSLAVNVGANLSMMLGRFETRIFIPDDEPGVPTNVTYNETRVTPVLGLSTGVNWNRQFGKTMVSLAGGYEINSWFNLVDSRVFTDTYMEGQNVHSVNDLSLDGAFVRVAFSR